MNNMKSSFAIRAQTSLYNVNKKKKSRSIKKLIFILSYLLLVVLLVKFSGSDIAKNAFKAHFSDEGNKIAKNDPHEEKMMIGYFSEITGNENVAKLTVKYTDQYDIEPTLLVALMKIESAFDPNAINRNTNGSIDRGLCQLNNNTFKDLKPYEFYDPEINIKKASEFLNWCLNRSKHNLVKALAFYNAGIGQVTKRKVGESTLDYINKIINEKESLETGLNNYYLKNSNFFFN